MAQRRARQSLLARRTARFGAWPLYALLLCTSGCFMEGYGLYADASSADTATPGDPPPSVGSTADANDERDGPGEGDAAAQEPTGDGALTPALDGSASGPDGGAPDGGRSDGGMEMDSSGETGALITDASNGGMPDADASDAARDAGPLDAAGSACTGATTCAPQCTSSPCALDCADAGTCDVTCRAGQTCNIDCGNAGTCNVTCQAGALCHTQCINIQFCPIDCQQGASCRNTCATGGDCGFSTLCTRGYRWCGQIAACGDDASC